MPGRQHSVWLTWPGRGRHLSAGLELERTGKGWKWKATNSNKMPIILRNSGCRLTLKTGTVIIGVLQALGGFSVMLSEAVNAYRSDSPVTSSEDVTSRQEGASLRSFLQGHKEMCIALSVCGSLQLILSVLLLYGADYEAPRLVKPWIIFSMVFTGITIATYFGLGIMAVIMGMERVGSSILVGLVLVSGINVYSILVVYSFYRYLVESQSPCII